MTVELKTAFANVSSFEEWANLPIPGIHTNITPESIDLMNKIDLNNHLI